MAQEGLAERLDRGLEQGGIALEPDQRELLLDYLALLHKWNSAYNLTAVRDPAMMVSRHLLDSLALLPWLDETDGAVLDVGTGAGLPGIPLAIARPQRHFVLLDSNGKKTRFLFQVRLSLALSNVDMVADRIEDYDPRDPPGVIVSRAFASLTRFRQLTRHLWDHEDRDTTILAMKAADTDNELAELRRETAGDSLPDWQYRTVSLSIPGSGTDRRLVIMNRRTMESTGS